MTHSKRRIFFIILAIFIALFFSLQGALTINAASDNSSLDVSGSKTASPTELQGDERETTVTLSLPSGEYKNKIDIVFVMDNSTSVKNAGYDFSENAGALFDSIIENNPGVDLKVGVVKFRGYATDMLGGGLVPYEGNESAITAAIADNNVPGRGSNLHSGLVMADALLTDDIEVEDTHKYVILLTDGKSYIWNNDDDEPTTYYLQFLKSAAIQSSGKPVLTQVSGSNNKEINSATYNSVPYGADSVIYGTVDRNSSDYYQALFDADNSELTSTDTAYDFPAYYSEYFTDYTGSAQPTGTVANLKPSNGTTAFPNPYALYRTYYDYTPEAGTVWADPSFKYMTVSPYKLNADKTEFDTNTPDEDFYLLHPDPMQKGTYLAGHTWSDMGEKYHTAAVTLSPSDKAMSGGGLALPTSFSYWLRENSEIGAIITESDTVDALFEGIDNSIRYMIGSGTVTDVIGSDFTLKVPEDGSSPFRMTLAGESLPSTSLGDNKWAFGTAADGVYPYEVEYLPDSNSFK